MEDFKTPDGKFNPAYLPDFDILCRPAGVVRSPEEFEDLSELRLPPERMTKENLMERHEDIDSALWEAAPHLWKMRDNARGFERLRWDLAYNILCGELVAAKVNVEMNFDAALPPVMGGASFRQTWWEKGVAIPDTRDVSVYIIAPKEHIGAAVDMVQVFASQSVETETRNGLGFNCSTAYQALTAEDKNSVDPSKVCDNVGWYEAQQGVFFTIDRSMFERFRAVLGVGNFTSGGALPDLDAGRPLTDTERGIFPVGLSCDIPVPKLIFPKPKQP